MAIDLAALLKLKQELGFYGAGGGQKSLGQDVTEGIANLGQGFKTAGEGIGTGYDIYKKMLETEKLKNEITDLGTRLNLPSKEREAQLNQIFQNQSASQVAPNIYPQPSESQESPAQIGPNIPQVPAYTPLQAPATPRADFQKANPDLNLDLPMSENKDLATLRALGGGIAIYTNPLDPEKPPIIQPKTMAAPAGYILQGIVPTKTGAPLAVTNANANAPQNVYDAPSKIGEQVKRGDRLVTAAQQGINPYAEEKTRANILAELPSNQPANSAGGAAGRIQVAARQGKAIIAKAGTPQDLQLASSDLAYAIQRSAPLAEVLQGATYSNTWQTEMNRLLQKITSDPNGKDVPKLRQEMFDKFTELENSSKVFIQRQLQDVESIRGVGGLPQDWEQIKKRQLGEDFEPIQFSTSTSKAPQAGTVDGEYLFKGGDPADQKNWVKVKK